MLLLRGKSTYPYCSVFPSHLCFDRIDIAAQLVGGHDPRLAELIDQPSGKPLGCSSVSSRLHENVEDVPFDVDGTPQPMFLPSNRDNDLIQMPFVLGARTIAPDDRAGRNLQNVDQSD